MNMRAAPSGLVTKVSTVPLSLKRVAADGTFEGYGSVFDAIDDAGDVIVKGAYQTSLDAHREAGTQVRMLYQHDAAEPIGIWDEIVEDDVGLLMKGRLVLDVARAREAHALMKAGALDGLSIGFEMIDHEVMDVTDAARQYRSAGPLRAVDGRIRKLTRIDLWEVSVVTFPCNRFARIGAVKAADDMSPIVAALQRRQRAIETLVSSVA